MSRASSHPLGARSAVVGAVCGVGGALAMAASARAEQLVTRRPSSYVPGRTLAHLLRLRRPRADRVRRNLAMHYGTGAAVGAIRGVMAASNLRGPFASLMHANVRLAVDQTLENATGVGAPPWTWPREELVVDLVHKGVYALVTGALADRAIRPSPRSSARRRALGARRRGRA
jgi:hypothetical protein